ncbi:MAG TPA: flagellar protein FlgN, partial [Tepidisphaeraceae bacterium]|nr:flagellar protein FlgN [Tepidisphaeraceae bacterium]
LLQQLIAEHEKLLRQLDAQQAAMKKLDVRALEEACDQQQATRMRIAGLESRRRLVVGQLAAALRIPAPATLTRLAEAMPQGRGRLLELRGRLKGLMTQISTRSYVAGRLAGSVLGHLNTAMRLMSSAVEQAGLYTKHGVPQISQRIGVLEAVG